MAEENAKNVNETTPDLGKFESVDALARAYGELEAEFTRRSQKLKELEKRNKEAEEAQNAQPAVPSVSPEEAQEELYRKVMADEGVRARVLNDYFATLKGVPLMTGAGQGVIATAQKPKSIAEAGALALGYLKTKC